MKSTLLVLALTAALAVTPLAADIWVAPLPQGSDATGDGTPSNPYSTISYAYAQVTTPGETIRAQPGDYFDTIDATGQFVEIEPGVWVDKWVHIIAESPNPASTTIIGDNVNPVVTVGGSGGSLQGFTVMLGGESGVVGIGTVSIINNIIDSNEGEFGGGLRIESDTCLYGASVVNVIGNTITNNNAGTDGGGLFVSAGVNAADCQVDEVAVLIEGNTITGNTADDDGGGIEAHIETFPGTQEAVVIVRDNTVSGNDADDEGGGARFDAEGEGTETFIVTGNTVNSNTTLGAGGGLVARITASDLANHRTLLDNNSVQFNTADDDGGGIFAKVEVDRVVSHQTYSMIISNNFVDHNVSIGRLHGGGGILARYEASETTIAQADLAEFKVIGNTISYNESSLKGGGLAVHVQSNRDGPTGCLVSGFETSAQVDVESNLIVRNSTLVNAPGAGAYVTLESCLTSFSRSEFRLNTIAENSTDAGAAGVHLKFFTDETGLGEFLLSHSIVWSNNNGDGLGGPIPLATYVVDVDHSDVDGHSPDYVSWIGDRTGSNGNISTDPEFEDVSNDDFHLRSDSPVIEAGSRLIGAVPPTDFEGSPRAVDFDGDGLYVVDLGADEFFDCNDADTDGFGSPVGGGDHCTLDNCPGDYNPGQSDCDEDGVGDVCDADAVDADADGVDASCDLDDADATVCADLDGDSCDDCLSGVAYPANDGADFDSDGLCDDGDVDDDDDGVPDTQDANPLNPFVCGDADGDTCGDDCTSGTYDPFNDGPDFDSDGLCDAGDPDDDNDGIDDTQDSDPLNPSVCGDFDFDNCEDCLSGTFDPLNDGPDGDGDGRCAAGDSDDGDPFVCADDDADTCDDCARGMYDPTDDGTDTDNDGQCDDGDPDDDNDGVEDGSDCAPLTTGVSGPVGDVGATVHVGPGKQTMSWIDIYSSHVFNVYRGTVLDGFDFVYDHSCFEAQSAGTQVGIPADPPLSGMLYYYLVAGKNTCGEGTLGQATGGSERPNDTPCEVVLKDNDEDGILDIDDNCVMTPNPDQTDDDGDTVGNACDNCLNADNVDQANFDLDGFGDACDDCTDTDGDGWGNPEFPMNICGDDNCPDLPNSGQFDGDDDGVGNSCDECPTDPGNDDDNDGVCFAVDNCPVVPNPMQNDLDGDGEGDACDSCTDSDDDGYGNPGFLSNTCPVDNCPQNPNPGQDDFDGDNIGDDCDTCTDGDGDSYGDPGFPANTCPEDNCPTTSNPFQNDTDDDTVGDACDPCFANPDPGCLACPLETDPDGDGVCRLVVAAVKEGSGMEYVANESDPGIPGIDWVAEGYAVGPSWQSGVYGVGYETQPLPPDAHDLISTTVPADSQSIYTRASFDLPDPGAVARIEFGIDYDDGVVAWVNGIEFYRSDGMPAGDPAWDTPSLPHESSNQSDPVFDPILDLTAALLPHLHVGSNVLAVGVWDTAAPSSDLVLVPQLELVSTLDNCPGVSNPGQEDFDLDEIGDGCDPCTDSDDDGYGDPGFPSNICPEDNCPTVANPAQGDADGDGLGDRCDLCTDSDGDGYGDPGFPDNTCPDDNCTFVPNDQTDTDSDGLGDRCDACFQNPDLECVGCPDNPLADMDGDGACDEEDVPFEEGTAMTYLVNSSDPGIGMDWIGESFLPGLEWRGGAYGVGYDTSTSPPNAHDLITTYVPVGTRSVYTRVSFEVTGIASALQVLVGADWDDGYAVWINGSEIFRSDQMPAGDPTWNQPLPTQREPSNQSDPVYTPLTDVTTLALAALHDGTNVAAIGVWNASSGSSDLLLVPRLSIKSALDNCPDDPNFDQADDDGDEVGDVCDNCPQDFNPGQEDSDEDGIGDACDPT